MIKQKTLNKQGFTLIEILVVVLIIGVLAAIALPSYRKSVEKAKAVQAVTVLNDAAKAEQDFALVSSRYTSLWDNLIINQPDIVKGTVYCLGGENTENQDDCGSDSIYKVKLTVGNPEKNSVVMATRSINNPYGDYKLFKYMNGDPTIYCKASSVLQSNICEILGFPTGNLPETRNIDKEESINCTTELHGSVSNPSKYTCDRVTYDDGSFDERAYFANGNLYDLFTFNSKGKQTSDIWYYENGEKRGEALYDDNGVIQRSNAYYENGEFASSIYNNGKVIGSYGIFPLGEGETQNGFWLANFSEDEKRQSTIFYYPNGIPDTYDHYVNGSRHYRSIYNQDGTIKEFRCFNASCGGTGTCVGSACATSKYADYIPAHSSIPTYESYIKDQIMESMCSTGNNLVMC